MRAVGRATPPGPFWGKGATSVQHATARAESGIHYVRGVRRLQCCSVLRSAEHTTYIVFCTGHGTKHSRRAARLLRAVEHTHVKRPARV